jgi:hypothetical protein
MARTKGGYVEEGEETVVLRDLVGRQFARHDPAEKGGHVAAFSL